MSRTIRFSSIWILANLVCWYPALGNDICQKGDVGQRIQYTDTYGNIYDEKGKPIAEYKGWKISQGAVAKIELKKDTLFKIKAAISKGKETKEVTFYQKCKDFKALDVDCTKIQARIRNSIDVKQLQTIVDDHIGYCLKDSLAKRVEDKIMLLEAKAAYTKLAPDIELFLADKLKNKQRSSLGDRVKVFINKYGKVKGMRTEKALAIYVNEQLNVHPITKWFKERWWWFVLSTLVFLVSTLFLLIKLIRHWWNSELAVPNALKPILKTFGWEEKDTPPKEEIEFAKIDDEDTTSVPDNFPKETNFEWHIDNRMASIRKKIPVKEKFPDPNQRNSPKGMQADTPKPQLPKPKPKIQFYAGATTPTNNAFDEEDISQRQRKNSIFLLEQDNPNSSTANFYVIKDDEELHRVLIDTDCTMIAAACNFPNNYRGKRKIITKKHGTVEKREGYWYILHKADVYFE